MNQPTYSESYKNKSIKKYSFLNCIITDPCPKNGLL